MKLKSPRRPRDSQCKGNGCRAQVLTIPAPCLESRFVCVLDSAFLGLSRPRSPVAAETPSERRHGRSHFYWKLPFEATIAFLRRPRLTAE